MNAAATVVVAAATPATDAVIIATVAAVVATAAIAVAATAKIKKASEIYKSPAFFILKFGLIVCFVTLRRRYFLRFVLVINRAKVVDTVFGCRFPNHVITISEGGTKIAMSRVNISVCM